MNVAKRIFRLLSAKSRVDHDKAGLFRNASLDLALGHPGELEPQLGLGLRLCLGSIRGLAMHSTQQLLVAFLDRLQESQELFLTAEVFEHVAILDVLFQLSHSLLNCGQARELFDFFDGLRDDMGDP